MEVVIVVAVVVYNESMPLVVVVARVWARMASPASKSAVGACATRASRSLARTHTQHNTQRELACRAR